MSKSLDSSLFRLVPGPLFKNILSFLEFGSQLRVKRVCKLFFANVADYHSEQSRISQQILPIPFPIDQYFYLDREDTPYLRIVALQKKMHTAIGLAERLISDLQLNKSCDSLYQFLQAKQYCKNCVTLIFENLVKLISNANTPICTIESLIALLPTESLKMQGQPKFFNAYGLALALAHRSNYFAIITLRPLTQAVKEGFGIEYVKFFTAAYKWLFIHELAGYSYVSAFFEDLNLAEKSARKLDNLSALQAIDEAKDAFFYTHSYSLTTIPEEEEISSTVVMIELGKKGDSDRGPPSNI